MENKGTETLKALGENILWNGDCLELMKNIPDKSIDMILCDLPYGTTACKWDIIIPFEPLCCYYLKKKPFHDYEKATGKKAILGVRSEESLLRKTQYTSCFTSSGKFTPIHDLTQELEDKIIKQYNIEVPKIYDYIDRTGCAWVPIW